MYFFFLLNKMFTQFALFLLRVFWILSIWGTIKICHVSPTFMICTIQVDISSFIFDPYEQASKRLWRWNRQKLYYSYEKKSINNFSMHITGFILVMDRITATAVNRMLVWQPHPQPRCGCEYLNRNRNRGYFFQQPRIF